MSCFLHCINTNEIPSHFSFSYFFWISLRQLKYNIYHTTTAKVTFFHVKVYLLLNELEGQFTVSYIFSTSIYGPSEKQEGHELKKKQSAMTFSTEQENKVSKMFIISLGNSIEQESTLQSQAVCTLEYRPLNQPITAHIVPERYNKTCEDIMFSHKSFTWYFINLVFME